MGQSRGDVVSRVVMRDYPDEVTEGGTAFYIGETLFDNPYPYTDPRREAWTYGYETAKES